jgi:hypothetical protein
MGPEEDPTFIPSDEEEHNGQPDDDDEKSSSSDSEDEDEDEDEDEYGEEDEEQIRKNARKKFDKIISDLKEGRLVLDDKAKVQAFITSHGHHLLGKRSNHKDQNLLHMLADTGKDELPSRKIKYLVEALITTQWATREHIDLLAQTDTDGKTPLHCAIGLKHHKLAKIMVDFHPDIDRIIGTQSKRTNCLHLALGKRTSTSGDELIMSLIEKSSAKTLCDEDDDGLTPLHLAVDYARCDDGELSIVKAIVKKCPATMDTTYKHKEKGLLSPYRYHELRHLEEEKAAQESARKKREETRAGAAEPVVNGQRSQRKGDGNAKDDGPQRPTAPPSNAAERDRMAKMPTYEAPKGKFGSAAPTRSTTLDGPLQSKPRGEAKPEPKTTQDPSAKGEKEATDPKSKGKKKRSEKKETKSRSSRIKPTQESAAKIKEFLKLYCLRHKKHDEAVEFLYGVQQGRPLHHCPLPGCVPVY